MTIPTTAATAPAEMDHRLVNPVHSDGPPIPQAQALSTSSVVLPISARRTHRRPRTVDQMSPSGSTTDASGTRPAKKNTRGPCRQLKTGKVARVTNGSIPIGYDERHRAAPMAEQYSALAHDIGHVVRTFCPMLWKSWKAMSEETKITVRNQLSTNYNLEHMDEDKFAYVNRLFSERYKQRKSDLHQWFQEFDDPQVALEEGCPKELEDRQDSWVWLCGHFKDPTYVKKAKANKINRENKTLLHHSGSRPFSYRMEARRKEGLKFPEIDVFADFYVRPGNELTQSLHTTMVEK
ncbi:uncharacterized protein [Malus domestica]|uniref:uncharacterized protein isoform X1 n=1 Tax=Malus domestica TaxID=3750 RepID=UPI0039771275